MDDNRCFLCESKGYIDDEIGVRMCPRCHGEGHLTEREAHAYAREVRDQEKLDEARGK